MVLLCIIEWKRIVSNYHPSNAREVKNGPNKNADKRFVNDYQNPSHHVTPFFKNLSSFTQKEKIIVVGFKKNNLTVEKVNLKSSNFVGFLAHRKSSRFEILLSIVRVSINAKLRPEKHFKMEHFSETEIYIAKFSFHKKFVYSSVVNWLQFQQSTKNLSSFLRKFSTRFRRY